MNLNLEELLPLIKHENTLPILFKEKAVPLLAQEQPEQPEQESALDRVNVRQLLSLLRRIISESVYCTAFEFNDQFTRKMFRELVEPYLIDIQKRGGIENFMVVCDESNNTPGVIETNQFVADIYIQPTKAMSFVRLDFVATRSAISFLEVTNEY